MFYWVKTNWLVKRIFQNQIWSVANKKSTVYLTFDDGPTPEITDWVLDLLNKHEIKATFFCIGKNILENSSIFKRIIDNGHSVGNHTHHHLQGWNTQLKKYIEDIDQCQAEIENLNFGKTQKLFRPPYGKLTPWQSKAIRKRGYKIIMWDVLSADFDTSISPEKCLNNVNQNTTSGSIIVFHDSFKAANNLKFALPRTIEYLKKKGYSFETL